MLAIFTKIVAFFVSVLAFFGINISHTFETETNVPDVAEIVICDDGKVEITFSENPSTGYEWVYNVNEGKAVYAKEKYTSSDISGIAGAGGTVCYTFAVPADGVSEIQFDYLRSWEDSLPVYRYKAVITKENGVITSAVLVNMYEQ